jgi:tRNA pseudouridine synthase 9
VPDWVPAAEGEEVVIGHGTIPPGLGDEDLAADANTGSVILEGVGLVNIAEAARIQQQQGAETATA